MSLELNSSVEERQDVTEVADFEKQNISEIESFREKALSSHSNVTWFDRWLVKKMLAVVGSPPVRISLWDGMEVTPPCDNPVAVMIYCDRGALF